MSDFTLAKWGDSIEKRWAHKICQDFPNYERFWRTHVAPLTNRPFDIHLRPGIPRELADLTAYHHKVVRHLAVCYELISEEKKKMNSSRGFHEFYDRLHSAAEGVERFLNCSNNVLKRYGVKPERKSKKKRKKEGWKSRLSCLGDSSLPALRIEVLKRIGGYRNQLDHSLEFTRINDRVPRRDVIDKYADWRVVSQLREAGEWTTVLKRDFVDPLVVAEEDLKIATDCFNRIWEVILHEFSTVESNDLYQAEFRCPEAGSVETHQLDATGCISTASIAVSGDTSAEASIFSNRRFEEKK